MLGYTLRLPLTELRCRLWFLCFVLCFVFLLFFSLGQSPGLFGAPTPSVLGEYNIFNCSVARSRLSLGFGHVAGKDSSAVALGGFIAL